MVFVEVLSCWVLGVQSGCAWWFTWGDGCWKCVNI